jgi:hypothetical protein
MDWMMRVASGGRGDDLRDHLVRVLVPGLDALEVEHGEAPQPSHLDGEAGIGHAVHCRRDDGKLDAPAAELPRHVDLVRIDRDGARNQGDVVEPIRDPSLPSAPDPHAHLPHPPWSSFTPYRL